MGRIGAMLLATLMAMSCGVGEFKPQSPEPVLWVSEAAHNFGTIPATERVSHVITVRNMGGKPLNISRVQTSCGCTAAVLDHQFLQPGEETRLKVAFDPRGRRGPQSRSIWIHSNDPKMAKKQISVSASVEVAPPQKPKDAAEVKPKTPATGPAQPAAK